MAVDKAARDDGEVGAAALVPVERVGRGVDGDKNLVGRHLKVEIHRGLEALDVFLADVRVDGANLVGHDLALERVGVAKRSLRDAHDLGVLHRRAPPDAVVAHVVLVDLGDRLAHVARQFKVDILGDGLALPHAVDDRVARVGAVVRRGRVDNHGALHQHGQHARPQRLGLVELGLIAHRNLAPLATRRLFVCV